MQLTGCNYGNDIRMRGTKRSALLFIPYTVLGSTKIVLHSVPINNYHLQTIVASWIQRNIPEVMLLYIKCQSSFILVSYWLKEDHVTVTKFNC